MMVTQNILEIKHCVYINEIGQSMLEAQLLHTVQKTPRQIQDVNIMFSGRNTCVDGSTQKRDTNPTPMRLVEAETFDKSSEFGHCILT